jgi:hypothetical protein
VSGALIGDPPEYWREIEIDNIGRRAVMRSERAEGLIEVRVDKIAQLFHTLDPFPFREKDLDQDVEEYIVSWARELPSNQSIRIIVYLSDAEYKARVSQDISEPFSRYFSGRAVVTQNDLNEIFRIGRRSLGIGIVILLVCLAFAHLAAGYLTEMSFKQLAGESFLILGWVANWRPLEIFLYDWWPIAHRRDLYRRLASASVELRPHSSKLTTNESPP